MLDVVMCVLVVLAGHVFGALVVRHPQQLCNPLSELTGTFVTLGPNRMRHRQQHTECTRACRCTHTHKQQTGAGSKLASSSGNLGAGLDSHTDMPAASLCLAVKGTDPSEKAGPFRLTALFTMRGRRKNEHKGSLSHAGICFRSKCVRDSILRSCNGARLRDRSPHGTHKDLPVCACLEERVKNVDIHALDRQVQWSLSRFSLSLEVCTCFYKLKPRASCAHNFGVKVNQHAEGRQTPRVCVLGQAALVRQPSQQKRTGIRNAPI